MINDKKTERLVIEEENTEPVVEKTETPRPVKKANKYIVGIANKNTVFVRKEANDDSDILYILKKDKAVIIDPNTLDDKYYRVTIDSIIGFVIRDQITIK